MNEDVEDCIILEILVSLVCGLVGECHQLFTGVELLREVRMVLLSGQVAEHLN